MTFLVVWPRKQPTLFTFPFSYGSFKYFKNIIDMEGEVS